MRLRHRAEGLCAQCSRPAEASGVLCAKHSIKQKKTEAKRPHREREEHMRNTKYWVQLDQWPTNIQEHFLSLTAAPFDNPLGWAIAWEVVEKRLKGGKHDVV